MPSWISRLRYDSGGPTLADFLRPFFRTTRHATTSSIITTSSFTTSAFCAETKNFAAGAHFDSTRFYGFETFAKQELLDERKRAIYGSSAQTNFDFVCWAGQSLHWNPKDRAFTYKASSIGLFPDDIYGPGMCSVWKHEYKSYKKQNFTGFHSI